MNRPTLVLAPNKTLAAQLYQEFKGFFPKNAVEYFVSYYDYYQPEAYVPQSDTYIEKEAIINEEIDRMRLSATRSLLERRDVVIVASVSCIYGLGSPESYYRMLLFARQGATSTARRSCEAGGGAVHAQRPGFDPRHLPGPRRRHRAVARLRGAGDPHRAVRRRGGVDTAFTRSPASRSATRPGAHLPLEPLRRRPELKDAIKAIEAELERAQGVIERQGKLLEAQRLFSARCSTSRCCARSGTATASRTTRAISRAGLRDPPPTLLDYLPKDSLIIVDESHLTVPQVRGMYHGDKSRKTTLVEYGFRMPSALDNRPLNFEEFEERVGQTVFVSATPGPYELEKAGGVVVEQ